MSFRSMFVAATAFLTTASAHMTMDYPVPYSKALLDNGPISASQFPCKKQNGFEITEMNKMAVGEEQTLKLAGSAIHGGGSCQLSVTTDMNPTENSKFKVIMSMEGNCPSDQGNDHFKFKIPDSIPNGQATFAWTWFSRLSGAPELYMNCAPIEVTGGADDTTAFDALPDLLVANIGQGCTTVANKNTKFPNPGQNLLVDNKLADSELPTGDCGATGGGNEGTPETPASSAAPEAPSAPATSAPAIPSNPGGIFAPGASSSAGGAPAQSTLTTLVTVTAAPSAPVQPTSIAAAPTEAPATPSQPSGGEGAACSENGAVVCNGPNQFGLCNNGQVVWQDVAAGTICSNGVIQKRSTFNRQLRGRVARPRVIPGKDWAPEE
ncbi:hypothetical protein CC78DRAFT_538680 [Lojkania enalia]|uniref:Lytic polysaccharide monooxygenase n=1 Tax=Lojkania enalia TaxID=147567 RepID=A0A9P4TQZ2_9PLEO|nr:hypothetical protein CC78DRAFT_538680 [Didymosphaeria enalia]